MSSTDLAKLGIILNTEPFGKPEKKVFLTEEDKKEIAKEKSRLRSKAYREEHKGEEGYERVRQLATARYLARKHGFTLVKI